LTKTDRFAEYAYFSGITASSAAPLVFEKLSDKKKAVFDAGVLHSYPVCWL
jgi:isoleucyl-tRNA synthetase